MLSQQVMNRIQHIRMVTRQLMQGAQSGQAVTTRRGYGIEFHQVRDYVVGDDVRFIDWKGSARFNRLLVKECLEERNRRIIIALDVSSSVLYGSYQKKNDFMRDVAALLAFAGQYSQDSVGLVLFDDQVRQVIPPHNTINHVHHLITALYRYEPQGRAVTDIGAAITYCAQRWHKDSIVFLVSDFIDTRSTENVRVHSGGIDLVALRCYDHAERFLPADGGLLLEDIETGQRVQVDSLNWVNALLHERWAKQSSVLRCAGIDVVDIDAQEDYSMQLIALFKQRSMGHAGIHIQGNMLR